jgi:hypothetical protein
VVCLGAGCEARHAGCDITNACAKKVVLMRLQECVQHLCCMVQLCISQGFGVVDEAKLGGTKKLTIHVRVMRACSAAVAVLWSVDTLAALHIGVTRSRFCGHGSERCWKAGNLPTAEFACVVMVRVWFGS